MGYCAPVSIIQKVSKWSNIDAQCRANVASRKKDTKFYIAKAILNVDSTNPHYNSQNDTKQRKIPEADYFFH